MIKEHKSSSLGFHCDTEYTAKGGFVGNNSQMRNTAVAVLTMGDSRRLYMKKRFANSGRWLKNDPREEDTHEFLLNDQSIFVLHPDDEVPGARGYSDGSLSQFQHGGIKVTDGLSVAMVFRTVTTKANMHVTRNTKQLGAEDRKHMSTEIAPKGEPSKPRMQYYSEAKTAANLLKANMEKQFKAYVQTRLKNKTLFN